MTIRRRGVTTFWLAPYVIAGAWLAPAAAQLLGPEFQVNSYTTSYQSYPAVAVDGVGGFVVVWQSYGQDGSYHGVFGQRYDDTGAPVGTELQINAHPDGSQLEPSVATAAGGGFVVVWESWGQDGSYAGVFGQRFDADGIPAGVEFQVNAYTTDYQVYAAVASDAAGDFVVVWQSWEQDGAAYGVFGRRYDSNGAPLDGEFQVNSSTTYSQSHPAVAMDGAGNFLVVWQSTGAHGHGIFARHYDSAGMPTGPEFPVNSYTTNDQTEPAVAVDGAGSFVVAWQSEGQDGSYDGVFAQRLGPSGAPVGGEFRVNTLTTNDQRYPAVAAGDAGDFVVVWESFGQDGNLLGIYGQRFDAAGFPSGGERLINSVTTNNQATPAVAADSTGDFVVAWVSYGQDGSYQGIFARRGTAPLFADGFEAGDACVWSVAVGGGCP